jgi:hypothetical protein
VPLLPDGRNMRAGPGPNARGGAGTMPDGVDAGALLSPFTRPEQPAAPTSVATRQAIIFHIHAPHYSPANTASTVDARSCFGSKPSTERARVVSTMHTYLM